jgi:hypothetical protein
MRADEESDAFARLLWDGELPPQHLMQQLKSALKSECVETIIREDYDSAERLDRLSDGLRRAAAVDRRDASAAVVERLKKLRADLANENEEWDRLFDAFRVRQWR